MKLSAQALADHLEEQLAMGDDLARIAQWAYELYTDTRDITPEVRAELMRLMMMEEGEQFALSAEELSALVAKLRTG